MYFERTDTERRPLLSVLRSCPLSLVHVISIGVVQMDG